MKINDLARVIGGKHKGEIGFISNVGNRYLKIRQPHNQGKTITVKKKDVFYIKMDMSDEDNDS